MFCFARNELVQLGTFSFRSLAVLLKRTLVLDPESDYWYKQVRDGGMQIGEMKKDRHMNELTTRGGYLCVEVACGSGIKLEFRNDFSLIVCNKSQDGHLGSLEALNLS